LPFVSRLLTLYTVLLAWIFFRATDFQTAWTMAKAWLWWDSPGQGVIAIWSPAPEWHLPARCAALLAPMLALHVLTSVGLHMRARRAMPAWLVTVFLGVVAALALAFMPLHARPFIYFQF
jgi:alginate O-acetyltransferase complex protein AlgI